jgi:hypothetical protein
VPNILLSIVLGVPWTGKLDPIDAGWLNGSLPKQRGREKSRHPL